MAPQLFHLEGSSLEELKAKAAALYGPRALIVSAELVTVGGIRGVLARKHYEIVVEVPERDGDRPRRGGAGVTDGAGPQRSSRDSSRDDSRTGSRSGSRDGSIGGPSGESRGGAAGSSPGKASASSLGGARGGSSGGASASSLGAARGGSSGGDSSRSLGGAAVSGRPRGRRSAAAGASGLDALLEQAELDEVHLLGGSGADGTPKPRTALPAAVSTDSGLFAALMDDLTFATDPAPAPASTRVRPGVATGTRAAGAPGAGAGADGTGIGTRAVGISRPTAPGRESAAENSTAELSGSGAGFAAGARAGSASDTDTASDTGSDAAFLREGSGDPTDLPEVRGQILHAPAGVPAAPPVLRAPGDLVVVVGTPAVAWPVASSMATVLGRGASTAVAVSGPPSRVFPDVRSIDDRLEANAARAAGVDGGHAVFVALASEDPLADGRVLLSLRPDQVWLAVDAGRKEADTAAWVGALGRSMERAGLAPAGLAVVGSASTATPETVETLGLPIGWLEDRPAGEVAPASVPAPTATSTAGPRKPGGRRRAEPTGIE